MVFGVPVTWLMSGLGAAITAAIGLLIKLLRKIYKLESELLEIKSNQTIFNNKIDAQVDIHSIAEKICSNSDVRSLIVRSISSEVFLEKHEVIGSEIEKYLNSIGLYPKYQVVNDSYIAKLRKKLSKFN